MTVDDIKSMVADIKSVMDDDERAHGMEDTLHQKVLLEIAAFAPEPYNQMALEALKTEQLDFSMWCA